MRHAALLLVAASALTPRRRLSTRIYRAGGHSATRLYHAGGHGCLDMDSEECYVGGTMQMLREAPKFDYDTWLALHEGEAVKGVYALYESDDCVFVGVGDDAVGTLKDVRKGLGDDVYMKIEEHDADGVMSLVFGSWLDEASPDGVRPRVNAERSAARAAAMGF